MDLKALVKLSIITVRMSSKIDQNTKKRNAGHRKFNITDASEYLNISRNTTWRVIKHYKIRTFENPLDFRETLVSKDDLDRIKTILRPKKSRIRVKREKL